MDSEQNTTTARPQPSAPSADRPVEDVMTRPVVAVVEDNTMSDALSAMVRTGLRHLVVVDTMDRCLGVLSDRTVAGAWAHDPAAFTEVRVADVVDREPAVLPANATIRQAAAVMRARRIDALVIVDEFDRPLGILSSSDLVALLAAD